MAPLVMLVLLVLALGFFAYTMFHRLNVLRACEPENRLDRPGRRLRVLLEVGFGQRKLLYEKGAGLDARGHLRRLPGGRAAHRDADRPRLRRRLPVPAASAAAWAWPTSPW